MAAVSVKNENMRGPGRQFPLKLVDRTADSATFDIPITAMMLSAIAENKGFLRVAVVGRDYAKLRGLVAVND